MDLASELAMGRQWKKLPKTLAAPWALSSWLGCSRSPYFRAKILPRPWLMVKATMAMGIAFSMTYEKGQATSHEINNRRQLTVQTIISHSAILSYTSTNINNHLKILQTIVCHHTIPTTY
jgi:hypothetical protein